VRIVGHSTKVAGVNALGTMSGDDARCTRGCQFVASACGGLTLLLGSLTLVAWATGMPLLASIRSSYIPMAPSTALGFVFLGTGLLAWIAAPGQSRRALAAAGGGLTTALGMVKWIEFSTRFHFGLEELLVRNPAMFGNVPTGRMSPITASEFILAGLSLLFLSFARTRRLAPALAVAFVSASLLVALGYLYGTPLLYGGSVIPVALSTALAFVCIGTGVLAAAGLREWPLRLLTGASARALLLRTFLPVTVIAVLVNGAVLRLVQAHFNLNPALLAALAGLVFGVGISAVILQVAAIIGRRIDAAEAARNQAQQALLLLNQQLEQRVAERTAALQQRNEQMEEELKMARELQLAMLPQQFPRVPRDSTSDQSALQFFKFYYPTGAVSGDFFDIIPLSDTAVGIFICDVMGHGVRAALVTAMLRALVEELSHQKLAPEELLMQINRDLAGILKHTGTMMYATGAYLVADLARGRLSCANAGHPSPLHLRAYDGEVEPITPSGKRGPAMGLFHDARYPSEVRPLRPGDFLVLFTDGLFEVDGPNGELYSHERLLAAVRQRANLNREQLLTEVLGEVKQFSVTQTFEDDVCLLGIEVTRLCNQEPK
jgi:serine phosphatase RsbU (regulator of sigma subunit)